jgi:hypothetical protein
MQTPAPIEYERATSVEQAIQKLNEYGYGARLLAGGHSLIPMMKLRMANPEHLIDINGLHELDYIERDGDVVRIGPLTRHATLQRSELLAELFPIFAEAEAVIADPVVRNRGTIGGSLAQADPAEDLSAVCEALKAEVVITGAEGARTVSMTDFHVGPYMTAVGAAEMVTEVRLKVRPGAGSAHCKLERRAAGGRGPLHHRRGAGRRACDRPGSVRSALRRGRGTRRGGIDAGGRRSRPDRVQAPPGRRSHQTRTGQRHRTRPASPGLRERNPWRSR